METSGSCPYSSTSGRYEFERGAMTTEFMTGDDKLHTQLSDGAKLKVIQFKEIAPVVTDIVTTATDNTNLQSPSRFLGKLIAPWDRLKVDIMDHFADSANTVLSRAAHSSNLEKSQRLHASRQSHQNIINPDFKQSLKNGSDLAIVCCIGLMKFMSQNNNALVNDEQRPEYIKRSDQYISKLSRSDPMQVMLWHKRLQSNRPGLPTIAVNTRRRRYEFTNKLDAVAITAQDRTQYEIMTNGRRTSAATIGDIKSDIATPGCPILLDKTATKRLWTFVADKATERNLI